MSISQEQAIKIAQELLRSRNLEAEVHFESPSARLMKARDGKNEWCVIFNRVIPPDVVLSPEEIIVVVDEISGAARTEWTL